MRKPTLWFPTRSDTNLSAQPHKIARSMEFHIKEVEEMYYICSENKGSGQL